MSLSSVISQLDMKLVTVKYCSVSCKLLRWPGKWNQPVSKNNYVEESCPKRQFPLLCYYAIISALNCLWCLLDIKTPTSKDDHIVWPLISGHMSWENSKTQSFPYANIILRNILLSMVNMHQSDAALTRGSHPATGGCNWWLVVNSMLLT